MDCISALESRVLKDLELLNYPSKSWVPPTYRNGERIYDAIVVGAGQCGLSVAFGLMREKIDNILVIDARRPGREGPWTQFARMNTLRTGKHVTGPDLGTPSLTPRAWYEARYGTQAWKSTTYIARQDWQSYLTWFGKVLQLPIRNECKLVGFLPGAGHVGLVLNDQGHTRTVNTRKVILASGLEGNGCWSVPDVFAAVPTSLYAHTADDIDYRQYAGKRVGVIGGGASAFDNAATALEAGCASADICMRREVLPTVNLSDWTQFTGFLNHFADMPDDDRWNCLRFIMDHNQPPTQDSFDRCRRFENFRYHTGCPWTSVDVRDGEIHVVTPKGPMTFDFVVAATGYEVNLDKCAELASIVGDIRRWKDHYTPPAGKECDHLGHYPYLGDAFEFLEKREGTAPYLRNIHNFTFGATASMGLTGASVTGVKYGVSRLVRGITRDLYLEDFAFHDRSLRSYSEPELSIW